MIKDAWKLVDTPFVSNSAKSKVGAVVVASIGEISRKELIFALQSAWTFIHGCGDKRLIEEAKTLMAYDFNRPQTQPSQPTVSASDDGNSPPHPGGYYVMINHDQSCDHKPTLAAARLAGQALCDAEVLPATFSIQDGDGEHVEDILRSDGMDLSEQVANFASSHLQGEQPAG